MAGRQYFDRITLNGPPGLDVNGVVNLYAVASNPSGTLSASAGDRAFEISTGNEYICSGGTVWAATSATSAARSTFLFQPGGVADADTGLYTTWDTVHEAAATSVSGSNTLVTIIVDDSLGSPIITAGVWDMRNITLVGVAALGGVVGASSTVVETSQGTIFIQWALGIWDIALLHQSTLPLFSPDSALTIRTGERSTYASTIAPVFAATNASLSILMDNFTQFQQGGAGIRVATTTSPRALILTFSGAATIDNDTISGTGDLVLIGLTDVATYDVDQTNLTGAVSISGINPVYSPATSADWSGDPASMAAALDRIAAAVAGLLTNPIP